MAKITQEINLEVAKPNLFQAIVAKQSDYGSRYLKVTFVNNGDKIYIEPTLTATINAERPDGASKRFDAVVNDDGTVTAPLTGWMLELEGFVNCDISVMTEDGRLTTTDFSINVNEAACSDGDISDDEDYDVLKELIEEVEALKEDIDVNIPVADKNGTAGIVRIKPSYGITLGRYNDDSQENDTICTVSATSDEITAKKNTFKPITPSNLDYAVKKALTNSLIEWTDEEKKAVRDLLGIVNEEDYILKDYVLQGQSVDVTEKTGQLKTGDKYVMRFIRSSGTNRVEVDNVEATVKLQAITPDLACDCAVWKFYEMGWDKTVWLVLYTDSYNWTNTYFSVWKGDEDIAYERCDDELWGDTVTIRRA